MKPVIVGIALLLLAFLLAVVVVILPARASDQCRFQHLDKGTWTQHEEDVTARCVVNRWPIPGGLSKLKAVGECESGWWRLSRSPYGYVGLFQHDLSSWPYRVRTYAPWGWTLRGRWQNSRTQLVVTVRMVRALGWSPWSCA
jgi:hypothetical protein